MYLSAMPFDLTHVLLLELNKGKGRHSHKLVLVISYYYNFSYAGHGSILQLFSIVLVLVQCMRAGYML